MSTVGCDFLQKTPDFISDCHTRFVILIRNSHHSVISTYSKFGKEDTVLSTGRSRASFGRVIDEMSNIMGYKATYESYKLIAGVKKPIIIFAEELYLNPRESLKKTILSFE